MSHSVTGTVSSLARVQAGYGEGATDVGISVNVSVEVPYVQINEYSKEPENKTYFQNVVMFYPSPEVPPMIGDEVDITLTPIE